MFLLLSESIWVFCKMMVKRVKLSIRLHCFCKGVDDGWNQHSEEDAAVMARRRSMQRQL